MLSKPYPFQRRGVRKMERFLADGAVLNADEMGLGKTFSSLYWIWNYYQFSDGPVIVVCPAGIKWQWEDEAKRHVGVRCEVLEGMTPSRRGIRREAPIYIIGYPTLAAWMPHLRALEPGVVIFDEIHYLKNRIAKRTIAAKMLAKKIPYRIGLSGTPLLNRPAELWSGLNILRPDLYPSFFAYAFRFCKPERRPWGMTYKGATNLPELHLELKANLMVRRKKAQVLKDLPAKQRTVIPMDIEHRKEYVYAEKDFIGWLEKSKRRRLKLAALAAEALVKRGELKRLAGRLKLKSVISWIEDWLEETDEKIILFGIHKKVLRPLYAHFQKQAVLVDGSVTGRKRQQAVNQFTHDKQIRIFVGNIHAAGVGWNGTAASAVAFVELDWVPGNHVQAEDRIHRIGQTLKATIYYLVARNTVEHDLCQILQRKQVVLDSTLDGKSQDDSLDIFDQVDAMVTDRVKG